MEKIIKIGKFIPNNKGKHTMTQTYWQPMTDEDVEWVNNPGKPSENHCLFF
jgi:hypothetical protein